MVTFKLIRPDKASTEPDQDKAFLRSLPITIAVCALAVWWNMLGLLLALTGVALVLQLFGIPRRLLRDWPRNIDVIGQLHVDEHGLVHSVEGGREPFLFKAMRSALLAHNHIKGEPLGPRDMAHNGIATLTLTMQDAQERTMKFLVERREQVPDVEFLLGNMYKQGVQLKEHVGRLRLKTILFKLGRSYAEIQALKKELGVDGFY